MRQKNYLHVNFRQYVLVKYVNQLKAVTYIISFSTISEIITLFKKIFDQMHRVDSRHI